MSGKKSVFDNPVLSTKVKSANVKILPEALIGYLVGPFCGLLANSLFGSYLVQYFQTVLFAEEIAAGDTGIQTFLTIFPMLSAILIVAGNLLAGQIIERTKTRAGKARPYILLSSVVLAVASVLMFIQPADNKIFKMVWLVVAYNLFYAVAFPLYNTANSALVPVSTRNGKQRGWLASFVNMASLGGAGAASIVFPSIFALLTDSTRYFLLFLVIGIVTFVGCVAQYYFTRERVTEESLVRGTAAAEEKNNAKVAGPSIGKQAKALFTDKFFVVAIVFYLLYQFSGAIKNASMESYTYMWEALLGTEAPMSQELYMTVLGVVGAVPMAVAILFVSPLCNKFGKRPVVFIGMALGVIGGVIAGIWYDNAVIVCVGVALKCLGSAPAGYMILAMIADCLDHIEAKNGFRCDGFGMSLYSSVLIASVPIATGVVSGLSGLDMLGVSGYGLVIAYIWIETGAYALAAIVVLFFGVEKYITEDRRIVLDRQRAEAEAAGIEWIPPEERLRLEEEEADRLAEEARIAELKAKCEKKGLDFEAEERAYQEKLQAKKRKKENGKE